MSTTVISYIVLTLIVACDLAAPALPLGINRHHQQQYPDDMIGLQDRSSDEDSAADSSAIRHDLLWLLNHSNRRVLSGE